MATYKGINYLKQRKEGYCVAISIINALKWAGAKNISEKDLDFIYKKAGNPGSDNGTPQLKVTKALKMCKKYLKSRYVKHPKFREINSWLKKGNAFIFDYFVEYHANIEIGHSVFVLYDENKKTNKFVVINDYGKTIVFINEEKFKKFFKKTKHYPAGYFIERAND